MYQPETYLCDICGKAMPLRAWSLFRRERYVMRIEYSEYDLSCNRHPIKCKVDICPDCFKRLEQKVREEVIKHE